MALTLKLNLSSILERGFNREQRIALSPAIKEESVKREFGNRVVDRILERTNQGIDKKSRKFKGYSSSYKKSLNFAIFGKTNKVNLKLSGEMHASVLVGETKGNSVTIAIVDPEQEAKARGHINGANNLPIRDWFGLPLDDQTAILKSVLKDQNAAERLNEIQDALDLLDLDVTVETVIGQEPQQTGVLEGSVLDILSRLIRS